MQGAWCCCFLKATELLTNIQADIVHFFQIEIDALDWPFSKTKVGDP
jgi:hypothetical protein